MKEREAEILNNAREFVRNELKSDCSGHDWWHIVRVTEMAKTIANAEKADAFICELSALLHDIADVKLNLSKAAGLARVRKWLESNGVEQRSKNHVIEIISTMSYNGGLNPPMASLEGKIVQDADRLDAIGAIGIARTFAYAGWKGHLIHDPDVTARSHMTEEEYRSGEGTAIRHFYEKLLKLKDLINTDYAKQIAEQRHKVMVDYLQQFYLEWEGS